jgi:uncharacterized protein YndB with AHSA1/START domain
MAHAQNAVTVNRPIADVFAFLADGLNNPQWRSGVLEIEQTSPQAGEGASYRQVLSGPGGRRIRGDYQITSFDPPHALTFTVTAGPARPTGRFELTEDGPTQTTVTFTLDLQPTGLMRLMNSMITKTMRAEVDQLNQLKQQLDQ